MQLRTMATLTAILATASCGTGSDATPPDYTAIEQEVDSTVQAFQAAEVARDGERIIAFLAPDFYMYTDGVRQDYLTTVDQIVTQMPNLKSFATEWTALEVTVLAPDAAVVSALFRDSVISPTSVLTQTQGPFTSVWRRDGADWRMVYADVDHYPVTAEVDAP